MSARTPACCLIIAALLPCACSCRHATAEPRESYQQDLAARDRAARDSASLYQRGLDADAGGKPETARDLLLQSVAADEDNAPAWMALGGVEFQLEHYYEAAEAFHHAARLAPSRYEPHFNLGTVLETVGHYGDAIKAYEVALGLAPDEVEVMENMARTLVRSGRDPERAEALVYRALRAEFRPEWRAWLLLQASRFEQTNRAGATVPTGVPASQPAPVSN